MHRALVAHRTAKWPDVAANVNSMVTLLFAEANCHRNDLARYNLQTAFRWLVLWE